MKYIITIFALVLGTAVSTGQSCDIDGMKYYTFADITEVLDANNCNSCHTAEASQPSWTYQEYESVFTTSTCETSLIVRGNAGGSVFYELLSDGSNSCASPTSNNNHTLSQQDIFAIESWINNGAVEHCIPLYEDVKETLVAHSCNTCHTNSSSWSPLSYGHATGQSSTNLCDDITVDFDAASSVLYQVASLGTSNCNTTGTHDVLSPEAQDQLRDWINAGTLEAAFALPVELSYYDLQYTFDSHIELVWTSAAEIGTEKYIVERSFDGRKYENIGERTATGGIGFSTNYSFVDAEEFVGIAYYRLLILDTDGSYSYSHIKSAQKSPTREVLWIKPNLISQGSNLFVEWYSDQDRPFTYAYIVDITGIEMKKQPISNGKNVFSLPDLAKGMYYLIVYDYYNSQVIKRFVVTD